MNGWGDEPEEDDREHGVGGSVDGVWGEVGGSSDSVDDPRLTSADEHPFEVPPESRYERGPLLGAGGMGKVYATHDRRLRRQVARKDASPTAGPGGHARLAQEAWITAQLEHPGIVAVYDAGTHPDGTPWYTMRLVRGRTLSDAAKGAGPEELPGLVRHLLAATEAVAYAHSREIIHRDLKPENILVGEFGETQVADWGLARFVDGPGGRARAGRLARTATSTGAKRGRRPGATSGPGATVAGSVVGTPAYMSPEQVRGEAASKRSDVWSLGATLRELITGKPLYGDSDPQLTLRLRQAGADHIGLDPLEGPPELVAIAERALAEAPKDRYPDAVALAADLARYLDGRRVLAHSYSAAELLGRVARLWRAPLMVAAAAFVVLMVVVAGAWLRTAREEARALEAEAAAVAARGRAEANLASALVAQARAAERSGDRAQAERLALAALGSGELPAARGVLVGVDSGARPERLDAVSTGACDRRVLGAADGPWVCVVGTMVQGRGPSGERLWERQFGEGLRVSGLATGGFLAWYLDAPIHRLDAADGRTVAELPYDPFVLPEWVELSPDGRNAVMGRAAFWTLYDAESGELTRIQPCTGEMAALRPTWLAEGPAVGCADHSFARGRLVDGRVTFQSTVLPIDVIGKSLLRTVPWGPDELVTTTHFGRVSVLDRKTGALRTSIQLAEHPLYGVATDLERGVIAVLGERGDVAVWRPGEESAVILPSTAESIAFNDIGELVLLGEQRERWRIPTRLAPKRLHTLAGLSTVTLSPDRATAVGSRGDGLLAVWHIDSGESKTVEAAPFIVVKDGTFTPDGRSYVAVVATAEGPGVFVFDEDWQRGPATNIGGYRRVASLANGQLMLVNYGPAGAVLLDDHDTSRDTRRTAGWPGMTWDLDVSPSMKRVIVAGKRDEQEHVVVSELVDGELAPPHEVPVDGPRTVAIDDRGSFVVGVRGAVLQFGPEGQPGARLESAMQIPTTVAVSPDGTLAAAGDLAGNIWLWDRPTGELLAQVRAHDSRVSGLAFRSDDELVSASWDATMRLWYLRSLRQPVDDMLAELGPWAKGLEDTLLEVP